MWSLRGHGGRQSGRWWRCAPGGRRARWRSLKSYPSSVHDRLRGTVLLCRCGSRSASSGRSAARRSWAPDRTVLARRSGGQALRSFVATGRASLTLTNRRAGRSGWTAFCHVALVATIVDGGLVGELGPMVGELHPDDFVHGWLRCWTVVGGGSSGGVVVVASRPRRSPERTSVALRSKRPTRSLTLAQLLPLLRP